MTEGEVKECSKNRRFEEKYRTKTLTRPSPMLVFICTVAFLHFSNARRENVAYLFLRFLFRSPSLHFLSNSHSDTQTYS